MSKRSGSENRQRQTMVPVRFNPDEYAVLARAAALTGKSHAALLRETFLTAANRGPVPQGGPVMADRPTLRDRVPEPADPLAVFLTVAEARILEAPKTSTERASEPLISSGTYYAPRLLAAVKAALEHHQPGKLPWCDACGPSRQPCQEVADIRRALLGKGEQ